MDLLSIGQQEKKVSLLTLPRSDLIVKAKHGSSNADEDKAATARNNQENESPSKKPTTNKQLVLMQLPKGMSMAELASGCHFVAPRANDSNKKSPAARQASLVVESKQQSYSVSRLETSNVLILVPPAQDTTRTVPIQNSTTTKQPQENNGPSPSKKPKVSASDTSRSSTSSLLPVSARLLQPGGSGASFLELRRKMLRPGDLLALLQKHLFDPYNNSDADKRNAITNPYSNSNNKTSTSNKPLGRTVDSLARELQCSQGQVKMALPMVQGFLIPSNATNTDDAIPRYGLLSEEALREAQNGIIATLAESDDFGDYAFKGVDLEAFLPQVVERFSSSQSYPALEHVIRFALTTLIQTNYSRDEMLLQVPATGTVQLDVKKVCGFLLLTFLIMLLSSVQT